MASDMPIGLVVGDGPGHDDPGAPVGRELEIAELLTFIKREKISNIIWITGDVHYAAIATRPRTPPSPISSPSGSSWPGPSTREPSPRHPRGRLGPSVRFLSIPKGMKPDAPALGRTRDSFGKGVDDDPGDDGEPSRPLRKKLWSISLPAVEA